MINQLVKKRKRSGLRRGFLICTIGEIDKSRCISYFPTVPKEAYGSELAKHLNLTTATVSHHMNALLLAGLVKVSHVDHRVYYTTDKKALEEVLDYGKGILT